MASAAQSAAKYRCSKCNHSPGRLFRIARRVTSPRQLRRRRASSQVLFYRNVAFARYSWWRCLLSRGERNICSRRLFTFPSSFTLVVYAATLLFATHTSRCFHYICRNICSRHCATWFTLGRHYDDKTFAFANAKQVSRLRPLK